MLDRLYAGEILCFSAFARDASVGLRSLENTASAHSQ